MDVRGCLALCDKQRGVVGTYMYKDMGKSMGLVKMMAVLKGKVVKLQGLRSIKHNKSMSE